MTEIDPGRFKEIGARLRAHRMSHGLSTEALAQQIGTSCAAL